MEERLDRLEREITLLKRREKEVYLVSKRHSYSERYDNIGLFTNPEDAHSKAVEISEYTCVDFLVTDLLNLQVSQCHTYGDSLVVKVEKLLLTD